MGVEFSAQSLYHCGAERPQEGEPSEGGGCSVARLG